MSKVSVIVYLSSKKGYLKPLNSLLAQTLKDIEIICVCNISNKEYKTLSDFAVADKRIKLYKTDSFKGESYNFALKKAKSDYVIFLNSNDNLKANALEISYNQISKNADDMVIFNSGNCVNFSSSPLCKRAWAYGFILNFDFKYKDFCLCQTKAAIYNKKFLLENKLFFKETKKPNERDFFYKAMINASKISKIDNVSDKNSTKIKLNCPTKNEQIIQKNLNEKYKINYDNILKRLKNKKKLRVLFLVNEISKWKAQALFDLMKKSDKFEPYIVLTISDIQVNYPKDKKEYILKENESFFKKRKMACFPGFDIKKDYAIDLKEFKPDIVFYEQPYNLDRFQDTLNVSKYALTMYFPYYVASFKNLPLDCGRFFHSGLFRYYVLNSEFKKEYSSFMKNKGRNLKVIGHPMLDNIKFNPDSNKKDYVIYAPHWSITHPQNLNNINISTFLEYGEMILNYAFNHPEINWAFKPHPTLKNTLERIWGNEKTENYYKNWEKIANCCYGADYLELFYQSRLLITDCDSFLTEYFCTGKPIIHLISKNASHGYYDYAQKTTESYYKVKNVDDLEGYFEKLIIKNEDKLKQRRIALLRKYKLNNSKFSLKIIGDLEKLL